MVEFADAVYYNQSYSVNASVIRIGSVPRFDQTWEVSWFVKASFFQEVDLEKAETSTLKEGFNELMYDGQFAMHFNPAIGMSNDVNIRLYSSLGMEVSSHIPAHVNFADPDTHTNVGRTTGYGPQIGAGTVVNFGNTSLYTFGTMATGDVFNTPGYRFNSRTLNAGVRIGDTVNIRYTEGTKSWAPKDQKTTSFRRFTVGLILSELIR